VLALTLALALVPAQTRFEVQAAARLEGRARAATINDLPGASAAGDAQIAPSAVALLENGGSKAELGYETIVRMREPYAETRRTDVSHRQYFSYGWTREGHVHPYVKENFRYGTLDLASLRSAFGGNTMAAQTITSQGIREVMFEVDTGVSWPITQLTTLDTSVGFTYGGGVDELAQNMLHMQTSGRTQVRLLHHVGELDWLSGAVDAQYATFLHVSRFTTVGGTFRWKHLFTPTTAFTSGVGVAAITGEHHGDNSDYSRPFLPMPVAELGLTHQRPHGAHVLTLETLERIGPFLDRFLAGAYFRAESTTAIRYLFQERWQLSLLAGVARSIDAPIGVTSLYAEAEAGYVAPRYWKIALNATNSTVWTYDPAHPAAPVDYWLVTLGLTVHTEGNL
jgi:hypothetical protein